MNVARVKNTRKVTSEMDKAENCWVLCISTREIDQSIVDYIFNVTWGSHYSYVLTFGCFALLMETLRDVKFRPILSKLQWEKTK